jgi:2-keto-4-pentenoate hydratase
MKASAVRRDRTCCTQAGIAVFLTHACGQEGKKMRDDQLREAGRRLAAAWLGATSVETFPNEFRARSRAEAYVVQDEMARVIGQRVVGWKLGATSPAVRRLEGHDGPIIGRVFESVAFDSPAELPAARFPDARVECEFAFRLRDDVGPRPEPFFADDLAPRATLYLALEIIGNRYPKRPGQPKPSTVDEIADNGAGIGFVFGPEVADWRALDLQNLAIDIRVDDRPPAENFLGDDRCQPLNALVEAANILSARGIGLRAGQYVSTGAATNPQPISRGSRVRARFGELGEIFAAFV